MAVRSARTTTAADTATRSGRVPTQRRSQERVEQMLAAASTLIEAGGSDALRMSDIAAQAGVSIGSLYQYFPDKSAIIRTLAERFNQVGRQCVADELVDVESPADLATALDRSVDGFYAMFLEEPVMRDIWSGVQADKALQEMDLADIRDHAAMVRSVMEQVWPDRDRGELAAQAFLLMHVLAATVRLAIGLDRAEGDRLIADFKALLRREIL